MTRFPWSLGLAIAMALVVIRAQADVFEWTNPAGGDHATSDHWTLVSGDATPPPGGDDTARFNVPGAYAVQFSEDAASDLLQIQAGAVTFHGISPATTRTYTIGGVFPITQVNSGSTLSIAGEPGAIVLNAGQISAAGGIVVDGPSQLNGSTTSAHRVGVNDSSGSLTYQNDAHGTIAGPLLVGVSSTDDAEGVLTVQSGAELTTDSLQIATGASTARGQVTVNESGATLT